MPDSKPKSTDHSISWQRYKTKKQTKRGTKLARLCLNEKKLKNKDEKQCQKLKEKRESWKRKRVKRKRPRANTAKKNSKPLKWRGANT